MTNESCKTLAEIGERESIARLCSRLQMSGTVLVGPGDDCAVVRPSKGSEYDLVLTSDPVLCDVHFTEHTPMGKVGHKVVARSLSDIAAMGAEPLWALIDVQAPSDMPIGSLEQLYDGAGAVAAQHGLSIVGGDMTASQEFGVHLFACGRVPHGSARLRSGAAPGDLLMVTGMLGGSAYGKHLNFDPRVEQGQWLRGYASAMIDLSDGMATDGRHLALASAVDLCIDSAAIPISSVARESADSNAKAIQSALCDGEDFELLFSVPPSTAAELERRWAERFPGLELTRIGVARPGHGDLLLVDSAGNAKPYANSGYGHFKEG